MSEYEECLVARFHNETWDKREHASAFYKTAQSAEGDGFDEIFCCCRTLKLIKTVGVRKVGFIRY